MAAAERVIEAELEGLEHHHQVFAAAMELVLSGALQGHADLLLVQRDALPLLRSRMPARRSRRRPEARQGLEVLEERQSSPPSQANQGARQSAHCRRRRTQARPQARHESQEVGSVLIGAASQLARRRQASASTSSSISTNNRTTPPRSQPGKARRRQQLEARARPLACGGWRPEAPRPPPAGRRHLPS